ncbi:GIY-YIG nuclease family protein [Cucumibacter marinus]|uniref:GIY-YIG nuclease family protein n=1 Tax=Cucumibacter marinus TaxID=1121252 RepID=UPI00040C96F9|nr:GIY-YIG nuclease family protein [Cucumibacter marinus]
MQGFERASVYVLRCADGTFYTGITRKPVESRLWEHNQGLGDGYTSARRPVELVFVEAFDRIDEAIARERQIKGRSRRKKLALIAQDYERLPALSSRVAAKRKL